MAIDNSDLNALMSRVMVKVTWTSKRRIIKARKLMPPILLFLDTAERWFDYNIKQLHLIYRIKNNYWGPMRKYTLRKTYAYNKVAPDDFKSKQ